MHSSTVQLYSVSTMYLTTYDNTCVCIWHTCIRTFSVSMTPNTQSYVIIIEKFRGSIRQIHHERLPVIQFPGLRPKSIPQISPQPLIHETKFKWSLTMSQWMKKWILSHNCDPTTTTTKNSPPYSIEHQKVALLSIVQHEISYCTAHNHWIWHHPLRNIHVWHTFIKSLLTKIITANVLGWSPHSLWHPFFLAQVVAIYITIQ